MQILPPTSPNATAALVDVHGWPWTTTTPPTVVAVGDVGGRRTPQRPAVRRDRCDTESKLMLFLCGGRHGSTLWLTGCIFGVFQAANDRR